VDAGGGLGDSRGQQADGSPGGRGGVRTVGAVEADDRVEVDHAAALVLGDLGKRNPQLRGQGLVRQPGLAAIIRRKVMVKRRHSSGAQALNRTEPV